MGSLSFHCLSLSDWGSAVVIHHHQELNYDNMLTSHHKLMPPLVFSQLIPSPSSQLQANWHIRPSLCRNSPSAADLLYFVRGVNFSDAYCQSGSLTLPHLAHPVAAGTSVICFQYPVGFSSVRLLSLTLSKDDRLPLEKCSTSMPSREFFFLSSCLVGEKITFFHLLDGETSHPIHTRYLNDIAAIWAPTQRKKECWSIITVKPQHCFSISNEQICIVTVVCDCVLSENLNSYLFRANLSF